VTGRNPSVRRTSQTRPRGIGPAQPDVLPARAGRSPDPLVLPGDVIVVGYSRVRGLYLDFLKTAPIIGAFARY